METTQELKRLTAMERSGINQAQAAILTQETPRELVHTRQGKGGQTFDFLPHEEVTRILNSAFGHAWTSEVKQFGIIEGIECWVLLRLTARTEKGDIYKEQFGQQDYLTKMSTGDCLKGAASDALTKCASLLGIGLDLYGVTAKERKNGNGNGNGQANGNGGNLAAAKKDLKVKIDYFRGKANYADLINKLNKANTQEAINALNNEVIRLSV